MLKVILNKNLEEKNKISSQFIGNETFTEKFQVSSVYGYDTNINNIICGDTNSINFVPCYVQNDNIFISGFLNAYNEHQNICIKPDDFWLIIIQQISTEITNNAEQFRDLFVDHKDKKDILIFEDDVTQIISRFVGEIKKNTKENTINLFDCDFSTTSPLIKNVIHTTIMKSMEKYFNYSSMCTCGIPAVIFEGTQNDWILLQSKINNLVTFFQKFKKLNLYLLQVQKIIDMMVKTRLLSDSGEIEATTEISDFWSRLISYHYPYMSGEVAKIGGWLKDICYIYAHQDEKLAVSYLPKTCVTVDFKLNGSDAQISAGFFGIEENKSKFGNAFAFSQFWMIQKKNNNNKKNNSSDNEDSLSSESFD